MELTITNLLAIGVFLQAVVQTVKPIYDPESKRFSLPEVIAVVAGIIVAIIGQINLLEGIFTTDSTIALYILYGISGIVCGRSASFVHDLFNKMRNFNLDKASEGAEIATKLAEILKALFGIEVEKEPIIETDNEADDPDEADDPEEIE
jgi:hypothetical protein